MTTVRHGEYTPYYDYDDSNPHSIITAFDAAPTFQEKVQIASQVLYGPTQLWSREELALMGLIEAACHFADPGSEAQEKIFNFTEVLTARMIARQNSRTALRKSPILARQVQLDLNLLKPVFTENEMPDVEVLEEHYNDTVDNAGLAFSYLDGRLPNDRNTRDLIGYSSELVTRLLLQRFALNTFGDNSWMPLASQLTEDSLGRIFSSGFSEKWDVSVYTQLTPSAEINVPYRIQVKSGKNDIADTPDVTVISPQDLRLPNERSVSFAGIYYELADELHNPTRHLKYNLDARCEALTKKLG